MEPTINTLFKRLSFLGYGSYEIDNIVKSAEADDDDVSAAVFTALEKYVQLGTDYLDSYSK